MTQQSEVGAQQGVALVIGGSGGIGQAICRRLAEAGNDVALTYRNGADRAQVAAAAVQALDRRASAHALDLCDVEQVQRVVDEIELAYGGIHTVVYASGPKLTHDGFKPIASVLPDEWRRIVEADVIGYFNLLHACLPALRRTQGSVVALTTAGTRRYPSGDILSAGPKAAVELLTRGVAREEGRYGIRANCVGVGWIDAGQGREMKEIDGQASFMERFIKATPLRRLGTAEEVADAVQYLASDDARYVTGNLICVDGGGCV